MGLNRAHVGRGPVRHRRMAPHPHAFEVDSFFLMLPMRSLRIRPEPALHRNRRAWVSFHDADHGEGGEDALAWCEALLEREGIDGVDGEIWLQCFPRVAGHAFKPVSFWYCERRDGTVRAVLAEVHNTFGERHVYLLEGEGLAYGAEVQARKVFHVSPFAKVQGQYRFRFHRRTGSDARCIARIDLDDDSGRALLQTSIAGQLEPLSAAALRRAALAQPLHSWMLVARIHWHALRLWLKGVPWFSKPLPPTELVSR
ncbi:DUF1365 domain-containing protein [Inhella gelatinilytica]|uniref:DUF1365 domain-containing protein n=1 Tax=Inhella gelatinilytica TaxID=2795030 RepID=A0A931IUD7_9BURK|nr:DUF1365 domain-containing protein [Inhella gelatinilytica]MBH9551696.1 DUF1365 domain-containing protein [Inhella gelatinilytica]